VYSGFPGYEPGDFEIAIAVSGSLMLLMRSQRELQRSYIQAWWLKAEEYELFCDDENEGPCRNEDK
jgi:hypothetical protein